MHINGDNNTQINGNGNHIDNSQTTNNHFHIKPEQEEPPQAQELEWSMKVYRNKRFDILLFIFFMLLILFSNVLEFKLITIGSIIIIACLIWYFYIPYKFATFFYTTIYSDKIEYENSTIYYQDMRKIWRDNSTFFYKVHGTDDTTYNIPLSNFNEAEYLEYRVKQFFNHS